MWYAMRPPNIGSISVVLRERDWPPIVSSASTYISRPPASASSVIRPVRPTGRVASRYVPPNSKNSCW